MINTQPFGRRSFVPGFRETPAADPGDCKVRPVTLPNDGHGVGALASPTPSEFFQAGGQNRPKAEEELSKT